MRNLTKISYIKDKSVVIMIYLYYSRITKEMYKGGNMTNERGEENEKGKWQIPKGNHAGNTDSFDFSRSDWQ